MVWIQKRHHFSPPITRPSRPYDMNPEDYHRARIEELTRERERDGVSPNDPEYLLAVFKHQAEIDRRLSEARLARIAFLIGVGIGLGIGIFLASTFPAWRFVPA